MPYVTVPKDLINELETFGLLFETMCIRDLRVYADAIGAGIISGLISALMLTGLGDYVWKYVFVCWTGRVPYTYLQSVLGETSVGE